MKKFLTILCVFVLALSMAFSLVACGGNGGTQSPTGNGNNETQTPSTPDSGNNNGDSTDNGTTTPDNNKHTEITVTINENKVLNGYLNDSVPAQSLLSQLPLTVRLSDSDNDFCGGNININYSASDVQYGYKNGDLAFWTPANNFVIFVSEEENSANTGNLVILGKITDSLSLFDDISGSINVTLAVKEQSTPSTPETPVIPDNPQEPEQPETPEEKPSEADKQGEYQMRITVGNTVLIADMYDNSTAAAIRDMLPMELDMLDLYGREMCYRFPQSLPTDDARTTGYEVGEIVYYPPMHSFVIMYEQNGEHFQMQKLGKVQGDVSIFDGIGNVKIKFEIVEK